MKTYKTYTFRGQDPLIAEALEAVGNGKGADKAAAEASGVSRSTLRNWRTKKSRRTYASTLNAVVRAAGKKLTLEDL